MKRENTAKKNKNNIERASGVFLPISSLPSKYGIGSIGKSAYSFIEYLQLGKQKYWQILPINEPDSVHSPYASCSAYAGYTLLIDVDLLIEDGLIDSSCISQELLFEEDRVNCHRAKQIKETAFKCAFNSFDLLSSDYIKFKRKNAHWLNDYALYKAIKEVNNQKEWFNWDILLKSRKKSALIEFTKNHSRQIEYHIFLQYIFFSQWEKLKVRLNDADIRIIGDIPMYVSYDSHDVWANTKYFSLNSDLSKKFIAGVPPDYFSKDGQLWGNPLYNYDNMRKDNYLWWKRRIKHLSHMYDVVRLDHFRAFDAYYQIKAHAKNAKYGKWIKGEGLSLIDVITKSSRKMKIIAEDLGVQSKSLSILLENSGYFGMKVMQFAFNGDSGNVFLPHNYNKNCVAYLGTHDNDTTIGWWEKISNEEKKFIYNYSGYENDYEINRKLMKLLSRSRANLVIFTMQDILGQDSRYRINTPSTCHNNWEYMINSEQLRECDQTYLASLSHLFGR